MGEPFDMIEAFAAANSLAESYDGFIDIVAVEQTAQYNYVYQGRWSIRVRVKLGSSPAMMPEITIADHAQLESLKMSLAH